MTISVLFHPYHLSVGLPFCQTLGIRGVALSLFQSTCRCQPVLCNGSICPLLSLPDMKFPRDLFLVLYFFCFLSLTFLMPQDFFLIFYCLLTILVFLLLKIL